MTTRKPARPLVSSRTLEARLDGYAVGTRPSGSASPTEQSCGFLFGLGKRQPVLGNERTIDLPRTEVGAREVERFVGRLEHGVLS